MAIVRRSVLYNCLSSLRTCSLAARRSCFSVVALGIARRSAVCCRESDADVDRLDRSITVSRGR